MRKTAQSWQHSKRESAGVQHVQPFAVQIKVTGNRFRVNYDLLKARNDPNEEDVAERVYRVSHDWRGASIGLMAYFGPRLVRILHRWPVEGQARDGPGGRTERRSVGPGRSCGGQLRLLRRHSRRPAQCDRDGGSLLRFEKRADR